MNERERHVSFRVGLSAVITALSLFFIATPDLKAANVDSKEYKLLLQVGKFKDRSGGVETFWKDVIKVLAQINLKTQGNMEDQKVRFVSFVDTKDFDLRGEHGFVIRERIDIKEDTSPKKLKKITLKYRGEKLKDAANKDVLPTSGKDPEVKLEEDIVQLDKRRYSKSGTTRVKTKMEFATVSEISEIFHGIKDLPIQDKEVYKVNEFKAHEIKIDGAEIMLSDEHKAEPSFTFWYDQTKDGRLLAAEFSFGYKVSEQANVQDKLDRRAEDAFKAIQIELNAWIAISPKTKTQIAYEYEP